jgi:hypothetical protein
MYGFSSRDPARFVRAAGFPDTFHVLDPEVSITQVNNRPLLS